jgi:hypothetical protein
MVLKLCQNGTEALERGHHRKQIPLSIPVRPAKREWCTHTLLTCRTITITTTTTITTTITIAISNGSEVR